MLCGELVIRLYKKKTGKVIVACRICQEYVISICIKWGQDLTNQVLFAIYTKKFNYFLL